MKEETLKTAVLIMIAIGVLLGAFALHQIAETHNAIIIVKQHMACTNLGNTDMSISFWEMAGNLK